MKSIGELKFQALFAWLLCPNCCQRFHCFLPQKNNDFRGLDDDLPLHTHTLTIVVRGPYGVTVSGWPGNPAYTMEALTLGWRFSGIPLQSHPGVSHLCQRWLPRSGRLIWTSIPEIAPLCHSFVVQKSFGRTGLFFLSGEVLWEPATRWDHPVGCHPRSNQSDTGRVLRAQGSDVSARAFIKTKPRFSLTPPVSLWSWFGVAD